MAVKINAVSASIAVYRPQAKKVVMVNPTVQIVRSDTKSLSFRRLQVPETIEWEGEIPPLVAAAEPTGKPAKT
jgi:hypothetical protein